jgi:hypothetical protein
MATLSFVKPRKKEIITPEIKLVLFFATISFFMLVSTYTFFKIKTWNYKNKIVEAQESIHDYDRKIANLKDEILLIHEQEEQSEEIFVNNSLLKGSIQNLFDLVPDKITLTQATLEEKSLILYGITPTKEMYEYLLLAPLRSIFHESYTSFYTLDSGWQRFVSTNYLRSQEEEE